jgi:hypothetical protein
MAITISNLIVSNTVPAGTTIGVLTTTDASGAVVPCNYMLTKGSIGYFAIAGQQSGNCVERAGDAGTLLGPNSRNRIEYHIQWLRNLHGRCGDGRFAAAATAYHPN